MGCGRSVKDIENVLLEIEAETPTRHCVLAKFSGVFNPQDLAHKSLPPAISRLVFKVCLTYQTKAFQGITFEHEVEVKEWRAAEEGVKRLEMRKLRHPILLRLHEESGMALFCFPGFTQGTAQKREDRFHYSDIIDQLISVLAQSTSLSFNPIPIEKCVVALQSGESRRVRIIRSDFEAAEGRVFLAAPAQKKSVEELLADVISPYLQDATRRQLLTAIIEAVKDANTNSVVAYWLDEKVITRIRAWNAGAEFLFIWHNTAPSFATITRIMALLAALAEQLADGSTEELWQVILSLGRGEYVNLWNLAQKVGLSIRATKDAVLAAVQAGMLRPVYRLKTLDLVVDGAGDWTPEVRLLNRTFTTDRGETIDGGDPEQIEVAFERITLEQVQ